MLLVPGTEQPCIEGMPTSTWHSPVDTGPMLSNENEVQDFDSVVDG